ncbi:hypothetical protein [Paenibacillus swuensis]|uniref:hypothetical protein n=1 Tax=Paenibacillus swuensis TaxID=1178515 RepID=UPI000A8C7EBA|nr:hypothetical protein [Paenibacillus swuensis]
MRRVKGKKDYRNYIFCGPGPLTAKKAVTPWDEVANGQKGRYTAGGAAYGQKGRYAAGRDR